MSSSLLFCTFWKKIFHFLNFYLFYVRILKTFVIKFEGNVNMKKILIFYASYGGGHLNAAKSIYEYITNNYSKYDIEMIVNNIVWIGGINFGGSDFG